MTTDDLKAARASWQKVRDEPDPNNQTIGVLLWASIWVEKLLDAANPGAEPQSGSTQRMRRRVVSPRHARARLRSP